VNVPLHPRETSLKNKNDMRCRQMGKKWKTIEPGVWKPEKEGDSIEGVLVNKVPRDDTKDVSAKFYIEKPNGMFLVWGSAILEDRMQYAKVGQEVRITFKGTDKNKKGQKINLFQVDVADSEPTDAIADNTEDIEVEAVK